MVSNCSYGLYQIDENTLWFISIVALGQKKKREKKQKQKQKPPLHKLRIITYMEKYIYMFSP